MLLAHLITILFALFQCVLVSDLKELGKHLDMTQVTSDFDGTMPYSHPAWESFTKVTDT